MPPWKRNLLFVWWNNFVTAIGMMAFLPLFPFFVQRAGVEDPAAVRTWSGVLMAAAPLAAAFLGPFWGALGDRIGRKWMLLRANAGIVVFVGAMSFADSPWQILALRLGQGVFSGFVAPSLTLVSVSAPAERQGRVTSVLHTAVLAGGGRGTAARRLDERPRFSVLGVLGLCVTERAGSCYDGTVRRRTGRVDETLGAGRRSLGATRRAVHSCVSRRGRVAEAGPASVRC